MSDRKSKHEWIKPKTAAAMFDTSPSTLSRLVKMGLIQAKYMKGMSAKGGVRYNVESIRKNLIYDYNNTEKA